MTRLQIAHETGQGRAGDMSHDPSYDVFVRWNEAAKAELNVRVQGPLLSVPGRTHFMIWSLGAGMEQAASLQFSQVGYKKPSIPCPPCQL